MPRYNKYLQNVYIADGFADDCDDLIHRCLKVDFLRYAKFCEIWQDMQLSCMYQGRTSGAEIAELSEEVLHVAKHYMVSNTKNFEETVAGLFLVYALVNLQPFQGFASLRIVQEDLPAINRISSVARRDKRYDVLFILGAVLTKHTEYHAAVRERGMEYPIRKYLEGFATEDRLGARPKGVFYRQNEELDIIRELGGLELRYAAAKSAVAGGSNPDRNLNYVSPDLVKGMGDSLKNLISGIAESDGDDEEPHVDTMHSIKKKAMKSKVSQMKHLVSVDTGNTSTRSNKVKTSNSTNTPRKRKKIPYRSKKPTPKRRKQKSRISFETDDDFSLPSSDETYSDHSDPPTHDESTQESIPKEQEINIEIDSLPCLITSEESGQLYEIEIIDKLKRNTEKIEHKKLSELPGADVTITKLNKNEKKPVIVDVLKSDGLAEISKVKAEKQKVVVESVDELDTEDAVSRKKKKNRNLKSKLTRLGVLEVADMKPL